MIRVLIADDQRLFLESLSTCLRNYAEDIEVVGLAENGEEAFQRAMELRPDVILMDVHMPVVDGVEATRRIKEKLSDTRIIILSTYDEDEYVRKALKLGAAGYLLKDISPTELIACIRALKRERSPDLAEGRCPAHGAASWRTSLRPRGGSRSSFEWFDSLTSREREVFSLIARGCDNGQIAETLHIADIPCGIMSARSTRSST